MEQHSTAEYGQARYGVALYGRVQSRRQEIEAAIPKDKRHGGVQRETS